MAETKKPKNILKIENGKFRSTFQIKEAVPDIYIFQKPYALDEVDFMRLKKASSELTTWAHWILAPTVALGLNISAKIIVKKFNFSDIKDWEIVSIIIGVIIAGILLLLGKLLPSQKKNVIKKIEIYFKENEKSLGVFTKNE